MLGRIQTLLRYHIFYSGFFRFSVYWQDGEQIVISLWEAGGIRSGDFYLLLRCIFQ